jgi:hypothetical protein
MKSVKEKTGKVIDILGMDTCLTACAENAYAVKGTVKYLVASEDVSHTTDWNYKRLAETMKTKTNNNALEPEGVLEIIESFKAENLLSSLFYTMSVIDCSYLSEFAEKLKSFSEQLLKTKVDAKLIKNSFKKAQLFDNSNVPIKDKDKKINKRQLRDLDSLAKEIYNNNDIIDKDLKRTASELINLIDPNNKKAILFETHNKTKYDDANGLSIYAPEQGSIRNIDFYSTVSLAKETGWLEVVKKYGGTAFQPSDQYEVYKLTSV